MSVATIDRQCFILKSDLDRRTLSTSPQTQPPANPAATAVRPSPPNPMTSLSSSWPHGLDDVISTDAGWFVAQTKPCQEKAFARDLAHLGIDFFLPLCAYTSRAGGVKHQAWRAVFPQYVFFCGRIREDKSCDERHAAIKTAKLVRVIDVHSCDRQKFVSQLREVQKAIQANPHFGEESAVQPGATCRVLPPHGLAGYVGPCVRCKDSYTIFLVLDLLGLKTPVAIASEFVEPLD